LIFLYFLPVFCLIFCDFHAPPPPSSGAEAGVRKKKHSHEVRKSVMMTLALGISPFKVILALCIGTTNGSFWQRTA
jgi:hypothetical protein